MTDKVKKDSIRVKRSTLWIAGAIIVGILILAMVLNSGIFSNPNTEGTVKGVAGKGDIVENTGSSKVLAKGDPLLGDSDAAVSVVEFSDFECPFCKKALQSPIGGLKDSQMFNNGEVNLVYKHMPLSSIHADAQKAAEASECAKRQGNFWEYHDKLFKNQDSLGVSSLKQYAEDIGLDTNEFNSCLDNGEAKKKVSGDLQTAKEAGGRGTPFFVITNKETGESTSVSGAIPWNQLKSAIQQVK